MAGMTTLPGTGAVHRLEFPGGASYALNGLTRGRYPDEEWLEVRTRFVIESGWMANWSTDREFDEYDRSDHTTQIVATCGSVVTAGMRITQTRDFDGSMTGQMLAGRHAMRSRLNSEAMGLVIDAASTDQLFDVTRFAINNQVTGRARIVQALSYPTIIGGLMRKTHEVGGRGSLWVFATTSALHRWLLGIGSRPEVITKSLPGDADYDDTTFCVTDPLADLDRITSDRSTKMACSVADAMQLGYDHGLHPPA